MAHRRDIPPLHHNDFFAVHSQRRGIRDKAQLVLLTLGQDKCAQIIQNQQMTKMGDNRRRIESQVQAVNKRDLERSIAQSIGDGGP
jgi:glycerol-3-phosphate O-acyltransferase